MPEALDLSEEPQSEGPDVERYLNLVRRRHMQFLLPLLLGWLAVWGASWILPARYKSSTLILVEQPTMPKEYVQPNVSADLQDRLQSITQQILSRTRLLSIIDKLHLYGNGHSTLTPDEKIEIMRKDIVIELVRSSNEKEITGFSVGYSARDPQIAQQVTSELTDLFIDENLKARQQESESTTKFIESQLDNARTSLLEQEAKVREFQNKHQGELPSQQASNLQILSGLQAQLQNEQDVLNNAKQQGIYLQALIEQYRALGGATSTVDGKPVDLPTIDQQLDVLRSKLAELSSHYTDSYPDIVDLKDQINKTEKLRDELIAKLKNNRAHEGNSDEQPGSPSLADRSRNASTLQLESQLRANRAEIVNREQAVADLKVRINEYQSRLNSQPAREQELADLTRGYDQSKANFDELLKKKNGSAMATSMEQMQQGERFRMLDPPSLPMKPDFPNRLKFCWIGLAVGVVLGLIVVFGSELLDDRLYGEKEIKDLLPMRILSEIPEVVIPSDQRVKKRRMLLGWTATAFVFGTILAGTVFSFLRG